ncbi:MAG TPA: hypothetical protein V6C88_14995 [Chroococcidiopsis sp.]
MILIHIAQDMATSLPAVGDFWQTVHLHSPIDMSLLAQQTFQTDVFAGTRAWFDNFIKTGQAWALVIGIILGYLFRTFTSYG